MGFPERLLDLLFPPRCAFCRKLLPRGAEGMCETCQRELPWLSEKQAEQKIEFCTLCVSPLRYQGKVREAIHRYKFRGLASHAALYGLLMAQCVEDHLTLPFEVLTWAPLSAKRRAQRGYDQAELLAREAGKHLGLEAAATLKKVRHTTEQSGLKDEAARRANALGVYECTAPELVRGRRVLLVDDVVTSGATLSECARVLRTAGAAEVACVTLARAR